MKASKAVLALAALAQDSRLAIFRLLLEEDKGMSAGVIAECLNIPSATLSFHLSHLKNADLVTAEKEGRSIIYTANRKRAKKLARYIVGKKSAAEKLFAS